MFITSLIYYFLLSAQFLLWWVSKNDYYERLNPKYNLSTSEYILLMAALVLAYVSVCANSYYITKHIDFALYVRSWMIGFRVQSNFEKMSSLITHSWFYNDNEESESFDDLRGGSFQQLFSTNSTSINDSIGGTVQILRGQNNSFGHQNIAEDNKSIS